MNTKLKIHRSRVVIYYSNQKKIYRERTHVEVPRKDAERVRKLLNRNTVPSHLKTEMIPVMERKAYCDQILTTLIKKNNRTPSVKEFKKFLKKQPKNLDESKVIPLLEEHVERESERFSKGTKSKSSIKDYKSFLNLMKDFELENEVILEYSDLNSEFVDDLFEFMKHKRENTVEKQYRTIGGLKGSTIKKRFDNLKTFTKWLKKKLDVDLHTEIKEKISDFDLSSEELNPPVKRYALNREGLECLKDINPENESEQIAKDIFLISCYTSLRFSDLISLGKKHIKFIDGRPELQKQAVKTNCLMVIELKDDIFKIIEDYNFNLNRLTNAMLNKSLKNLLSRCEYFQAESEYYKEDGSLYKLFEIISCHTGRRTMISRLLNEFNVPPSRVMKISGHKTITSLNKYIVPDKLDFDINNL